MDIENVLLSKKEARDKLGISDYSLMQLINKGKLASVRIGRDIKVSAIVVEAFIRGEPMPIIDIEKAEVTEEVSTKGNVELEGIVMEARVAEAKIHLEEVQGLRDMPEKLKEERVSINALQLELAERESNVKEREVAIKELQEGLEGEAQTIAQNRHEIAQMLVRARQVSACLIRLQRYHDQFGKQDKEILENQNIVLNTQMVRLMLAERLDFQIALMEDKPEDVLQVLEHNVGKHSEIIAQLLVEANIWKNKK